MNLNIRQDLPTVVLKNTVAFPRINITFDLSKPGSSLAIKEAMNNDRLIFVVTQNGVDVPEAVNPGNMYAVGIIAKIRNVMKVSSPDLSEIIRVSVEGIRRASIIKVNKFKPFIACDVQLLEMKHCDDPVKADAMIRLLDEAFYTHISNNLKGGSEYTAGVHSNDLSLMSDLIAANLDIKPVVKQSLLEELDVYRRAVHLLEILNNENAILDIKNEINEQVKQNISKGQREYFLREQLKVVESMLDEISEVGSDIKEYEHRINKLGLNEEITQKLLREARRLKIVPSNSAENGVIREYLEVILSLPWGNKSNENKNLKKAANILNADHYGLDEIKERIVEYLAVRQKTKSINAPILCLVGPPGVGKTSIAKSIAKALDINYVRMSLGGIKDEAEIRGHRKTYIGAMPGRIIAAIRQAGTDNPLILLDEIDKLSSDYKGDPSSALLEVLDGAQNFAFRDNYVEIPYDVSKVFFMCTANSVDTIPHALRDRLEIITLSSYSEQEKLEIAKKYLLPKQLDEHGIDKKMLKLKPGAINEIINYYTYEAGVRSLERQIGTICRKYVKNEILSNEQKALSLDAKAVEKYLGKRKHKPERLASKNEIGVCRGLAWTALGGVTLTIEVNIIDGSGKHTITGNVGKVMNESYEAAISYIRANAKALGITADFEKTDIHIHIPQAATPKDGPSAGITMACAIISALTNTPIRRDVAMTGEITLRGNIMPIGGLKEKVLAAKRIGVKTVIIPSDNASDLNELDESIKTNIEFVLADKMSDVIKKTFCSPLNTASAIADDMLDTPVFYQQAQDIRRNQDEC